MLNIHAQPGPKTGALKDVTRLSPLPAISLRREPGDKGILKTKYKASIIPLTPSTSEALGSFPSSIEEERVMRESKSSTHLVN